MIFKHLLVAICLWYSTLSDAAPLKVVTTIPDLAELVREIGGTHVSVSSLLLGPEDPHFLDASPSYVRQIRDADVLCLMGLELEIGWLPRVLERAGQKQIQPGGEGYCEVGSGIKVLEVPASAVDRSMGHVHRFGNPHFNLGLPQLREGAAVIAAVLSRRRPEFRAEFGAAAERLSERLKRLESELKAQIQKTQADRSGRPSIIEYHREFTYFFAALGIVSAGSIEEKPGVPPSAGRLAQLAVELKAQRVPLAVGSLYSPERHLIKFTEITAIPHERWPHMVQSQDTNLNTIEKVQRHLIQKYLARVRDEK